MKVTLENIFGITKEQINIPLIIEDIPMGVVTDVTDENVSILLWDKFITVDRNFSFDNDDSKITAINIKHKFTSTDELNAFVLKGNDDNE